MSTVNKIIKNSIALYIAWGLGAFSTLVLNISIARKLHAVAFGKYSTAFVFANFFIILVNLGMNEILIREVARDKSLAPKYLSNIISVRLLLCVFVIPIILISVRYMNYSDDTTYAILIFGIAILISSLNDLFLVTFRAFENMEWEALITVFIKLLTVIISLVFLYFNFGIVELASAFLVAITVGFILSNIVCTKKFSNPRLEIDLFFCWKVLKDSLPFIFSNLFIMFYMKIDILMLSKMSGEANVGWYNAAASLSNTFGPMVFIFMSVLYPVASRFFVSRQDQLIILYEKSFKYLILIGLPLSAGTTVLAHRIIPLLYGDNFLKAATVLQILCWKFFLIAMSRPVLYMLASINKQKFMAISGGIGAILIIILNLYAIPTFQEIGAAVSVVFAEIVVTCVSWYIVGRYFYFLPFHRILFKPVLATVIMAYVVYQIKNYMDTNLFLLVFLGAAVYTIALFLFNAFDEDDLKIFSKIFRFSFLKSKDKQVKFNLFE